MLACAPTAPAVSAVPETLLTIEQAAAVLNVPRSWLRDKVTAHKVPHLRLGRHVRFAPEHLHRIIADSETAAGVSPESAPSRHHRRPDLVAYPQDDAASTA